MDTVRQYLPRIKLAQSSACIAAFSPLFYVREVLASYLNKPPADAVALDVTIALIRSVGVDFLAKANPLIGPALALAEAIKAHTERRREDLNRGTQERDRFLFLKDGISEGLDTVARAEQAIEDYRRSADQLDDEFNRAVTRGTAMLNVVGKDPK